MVIFEPYGPYKIPTDIHARSRLIAENLSGFWEKNELGDYKGCYIFSIRTGRSVTPYYVGMTSKSFADEAFTDHKLTKYNRVIAEYMKGTPVMSFVVSPVRRGRDNIKIIEDLENFLIQVGMTVNSDLRNIRGKKEPAWGIKGVIRGGQGPKTKMSKAFSLMLKMNK